MEIFYGGGGNNRPTFRYQFRMKKITDEMYTWCSDYPVTGSPHFKRFHILWNTAKQPDPIMQFEWEEPAITFALKFGDYII